MTFDCGTKFSTWTKSQLRMMYPLNEWPMNNIWRASAPLSPEALTWETNPVGSSGNLHKAHRGSYAGDSGSILFLQSFHQMLLLHESLPLNVKEWCILPESFLFFFQDGKRLHEAIFTLLNRKLYSTAWRFQPRTKREKWWKSTCYVEIQNMPALNPTQEGRDIFFLLKCMHFIFKPKSHFHLVTNFPICN